MSVLSIDRLVVTGPGISAQRAERFRVLVETAVRRRLESGVWSAAPDIVELGDPEKDGDAAEAVASQILAAVERAAGPGKDGPS